RRERCLLAPIGETPQQLAVAQPLGIVRRQDVPHMPQLQPRRCICHDRRPPAPRSDEARCEIPSIKAQREGGWLKFFGKDFWERQGRRPAPSAGFSTVSRQVNAYESNDTAGRIQKTDPRG